MIRDLLLDRPDNSITCDVCIVGAGASGIVLAVELVRLGKSVLMLEGGGAEIEEDSQNPYRSEIVGHRHNGIHTGRFRAKGGTTRKWGGQILELDSQDFEKRAAVAGSGWPFAKTALTQYYEKALQLEGLSNVERSDSAVWQQIGEEEPAFEELESYLSRWCPEPDFTYLHRQIIEQSEALTLWLHANVVAIQFEGETSRAVQCQTITGVGAVFQAREFVFCLGAIESSRFFLQPSMERHPWNTSGHLGKNFQDHIDCNIATVEPREDRRFHQVFDNIFTHGFKYHPKLRLAPSVQESLGTLNVAGTIAFTSDATEELATLKSTAKTLLRGRIGQLGGKDFAHAVRNLPLLVRQTWRYAMDHRIYNPPGGSILLRVHCEQEPLSASSITLSDCRDSLGLLRTRLDWRISENEVETIRAYVMVVQQSLAGLARVTPDADLMAHNAAFIEKCDDSNHHMGGMRMASSSAEGIVDPDLLLYGTKNVYVCSAAVFPTSGFSNPTHTLLALAVRLAEHLS
jgi:choline dehydrogenase-like flavoprotein